ncbi:MAG: hypothetical protein H7840_03265 [Alphaproteobacteria bacterium]
MSGTFHRRRVPVLALGFVSLVAGLAAGLGRLGWVTPEPVGGLLAVHGPLMVSGFLGAVIGLERAVALQARPAYVAPVLAGAGGLLLIVGSPGAAALLTLSSLGLLASSVAIVGRQRALFTVTMAGGAACWAVGNLLWTLGRPIPDAVPWWMLFLVLTIAGERLDLSRLMRPSRLGPPLFIAIVAVLVAGAAISVFETALGVGIMGGGMVALALWFARFDIARRTVRMPGLTRYVAVCLLTGYVWLAVGGALAMAAADAQAGPLYDATLHAVFLGFVFSMIFGHAPIILPAVLGLGVPFGPGLYAPLVVLTGSLAVRIIGDLGDADTLRLWGGLGGALAIVLFIGLTAATVRRGRRSRRG